MDIGDYIRTRAGFGWALPLPLPQELLFQYHIWCGNISVVYKMNHINVEGVVLPNVPLSNFQIIGAAKKLKIKNITTTSLTNKIYFQKHNIYRKKCCLTKRLRL